MFLHLWERPWAFDPDRGRLRAWLATMAHHRVDRLRRTAVRDRAAARAAVERQPRPRPTPRRPPSPPLAKRSGSPSTSSPPQRTAILLAYFEGHTFRQVAQLTGVPEGTAKSRLRLALRHLATASSPRAWPASGDADRSSAQRLSAGGPAGGTAAVRPGPSGPGRERRPSRPDPPAVVGTNGQAATPRRPAGGAGG